jgi:osmotically-inducible protein OsmY
LFGFGVGFCGIAGRAQQEPPQEGVASKAGEKIDEVGRAIRKGILDAEETVREGLNKTGGTMREGFAKTRESVQAMSLVPRVYGRLHWDKALHSSPLFVKAEGGTVTIRGTVPDDATKERAIGLVKDTVGVTRVIDQISALSASATTPRSAPRH